MNNFERRVREFWPDQANEILGVIRNEINPEDFRDVENWVKQCFHKPTSRELKVCALNQIIDGHGTEAVFGDSVTWPDFEYVNVGDSYVPTLILDYVDNCWYATSVGDHIEACEREGRIYQ